MKNLFAKLRSLGFTPSTAPFLVCLLTAALAFNNHVEQENIQAKRKAYTKALHVITQYMSSQAYSINGVQGLASRPTSLEINQIFSELFLYSSESPDIPDKFYGFFSSGDGAMQRDELYPELIMLFRKELDIDGKPKIPKYMNFRWLDEMTIHD